MSVYMERRDLKDPGVQHAVTEILKSNVLCSIATVGAGSRAHINTAYFAYSGDLEIIFYSYEDSDHSENLKENDSMAIAIFSSDQEWGLQDRGLQLFGTCRRAVGDEHELAERIYSGRFHEFIPWKRSVEKEPATSSLLPYIFRAESMKVFDEKEFGNGALIYVSSDKQ